MTPGPSLADTMTNEEKQAFEWSLNQCHRSVAALYARVLGLYIKRNAASCQMIAEIEKDYSNWRGKFRSLAEAIKWHVNGQNKVINNLREQQKALPDLIEAANRVVAQLKIGHVTKDAREDLETALEKAGVRI